MVECWICGRAMVTEPRHIPLPICRRARCEPEREFLAWATENEETSKEYATIEGWQ